MTYRFDAETALHEVADGHWHTELSTAWNIGDNPNGGYLLAPLLEAMGRGSGHPDPLTVTTHYLRPGQEGPAEIETEVVRTGRRIGTVRGRLIQGGKSRIESIAAFTDLADAESVVELATDIPPIPPPEECISRVELANAQGVVLPIMSRLDIRVDPALAAPAPGSDPVISGWIRFNDERPVDAKALTLFADAFPPPLFSMVGVIGWVPTVELTVQVRRRPVEGWIRGHFTTSDIAGNRTIEDGQLWDESGALVAQSRQVGLILAGQMP